VWGAAGYLEPLSEAYQCILFDHRGHGESDHPLGAAAYHIDRLADDGIAVLDDLEIESCAFWAYSNGISVGLRAAERHADHFRCLIGSGVIGRPATDDELQASVARAVSNHRTDGWEWLIVGFAEDEGSAVALAGDAQALATCGLACGLGHRVVGVFELADQKEDRNDQRLPGQPIRPAARASLPRQDSDRPAPLGHAPKANMAGRSTGTLAWASVRE
jgi:pimeloyl-ACP methyl ester carboxylesterase